MRKSTIGLLGLVASTWAVLASGAYAEDLEIRRQPIPDLKAVYGQVLSKDVIPARARISGTVDMLDVEEGSVVKAGQVIAHVTDPKMTLQMQTITARMTSLNAQLANAKDELARAETLLQRGVATRQQVDQLRTQMDVVSGQIAAADAERAVIEQQMSEGDVEAPADGRVISVPITRNSVILAGEMVAQVAGGGFFLRLALPERHAALLSTGLDIHMLGRPSQPIAGGGEPGRIVKIYPELDNGKVIADAEAAGLENFYVGERALVRVPVSTRLAIVVPEAAVTTRAGVDFVTIKRDSETLDVSVITGSPTGDGDVEILSGLVDGDVVIVP
ncbi:MAG: efflux RND transporter periplasmic adaptor subunit [Rhodobiaceae bacterium]|nr:efflux RND transporter periplasmic adaptor subunit [Rhodobiaceae bacterium]